MRVGAVIALRLMSAELGVPRSFGSYAELLADRGVDAVYVPLPIALHTEWTIRALQAGKHVLCEKPFAITAADAAACFDAAEVADRLCIEGLMWRHHPQTRLAQQLVADGAIGRLSHIRAALSVNVAPGDIRRIGKLGGGRHWIWAVTASAGSGCSAASRCASAPLRSLTQPRAPTAAICVSPRRSRCPATRSLSSTWRWISLAATSWN